MASNFWFKFNFKDWADDVKPLSLSARGLLLELIIYMRRPEQAGVMPLDIRLISRLTGGLTEEITEGLTELKKFGTLDFETQPGGGEKIISRKIVKEFSKTQINRQNGKKGGSPLLKKNEIRLTESDNQKDNRNSNSIFNSDSNFENNFKEGGTGGNYSQEAFDLFYSELLSSEVWVEQCAKHLRLPTKQDLHKYLREYLERENLAGELEKKPLQEVRRHFLNWARIEVSKRKNKTDNGNTGDWFKIG